MAGAKQRDLKNGELEIVWPNGNMEWIQTEGMTYNQVAIVCDVKGHKLIIPMSSVKRFRVKAI